MKGSFSIHTPVTHIWKKIKKGGGRDGVVGCFVTLQNKVFMCACTHVHTHRGELRK